MKEGDRIGDRYRLVNRLARGGMAEVWEALDEVLNRPVAVKLLLPHLAADPGFHARFHREAQQAGACRTRTSCRSTTCSSSGRRGDRDGARARPDASDVLESARALDPRPAISVARQVADALAHSLRAGSSLRASTGQHPSSPTTGACSSPTSASPEAAEEVSGPLTASRPGRRHRQVPVAPSR